MEDEVSVLTGLSVTVYALVSFIFWREGLVEYGVSETLSWLLAVPGTVLLIASAFGLGPLMILLEEASGGAASFGLIVVMAAAWFGYWQTIKTGGAPQWILSPASVITLIWDEPPRWAEVASHVLSMLLAVLVAAGSRPRRG